MRIKTTTKTEYQQRINVLVEYINNHLGEDIDLNKLAEISGFSRWHFHRIFAEFLGEPVGTFIVRMRVETAARLLRYTEIPVKEIAYKVGYDVPSSLSKVFRQFYGISPNEYRNNKDYVIMEPNTEMVDEVVVVAYGVRKKGTIAGSVSTVKAEKMENVPAAGFDQALQDRLRACRSSPTRENPARQPYSKSVVQTPSIRAHHRCLSWTACPLPARTSTPSARATIESNFRY